MELRGLSIQETFLAFMSDAPYVHEGRNYQNTMHYFIESLVGDRNFRSTMWSPGVPEYLLNVGGVPMRAEVIPTRRMTMQHPTKVFFATTDSQLTLIQRLVLVDQKEFYVVEEITIEGIPYSENFKLRGFYRVTSPSSNLMYYTYYPIK